jgi:hypothetical protein
LIFKSDFPNHRATSAYKALSPPNSEVMCINTTRLISFVLITRFLLAGFLNDARAQQGHIIPTGTAQGSITKACRLVLEASDEHYRSTGTLMDKTLFPDYGEYSVYWIGSGEQKGDFVFPDEIPQEYQYVKSGTYQDYDWQNGPHFSINFSKRPRTVAIFKSAFMADSVTLSWEALQFIKLFETYLFDDVFCVVDEEGLAGGLDPNTALLIIPAFTVKGEDYTYYIDSVAGLGYDFNSPLDAFLSRGGMIYTEGNAACFLEKTGYLESGTIDYSDYKSPENDLFTCEAAVQAVPEHPVTFAMGPTGSAIYGNRIPLVNASNVTPLVTLAEDGRPVVFSREGTDAGGGSILCNLGLPAVKGLADLDEGDRQLQWTLNAIMSAFAKPLDVTRSVRNDLAGYISAGPNAISYDRVDTFSVEILVRNLSGESIQDIQLAENIQPYFRFYRVTSGDACNINGNLLTIDIASLAAHSEKKIVYELITPGPDSEIHEDVDKYLAEGTYMTASYHTSTYTIGGRVITQQKSMDYADLLFSARIFADADVNWKNFLGLEYQPFKVFMIMENKERTPAEDVVYTQYIPKDVPFYWVDHSINIPILKTPGGKFVDVLRGSNDEDSPDYDMDSDGHPDVWLDTASIFPKGYTLTEEEVYWANPWNHLRTGDDSFVFEDIDHDGQVAVDNDGDGIVDVEEPGDRIRVWKVTWDVGRVEGYGYYDPYCSYEIWVDPPDLVPLAAGVGHAYDSLDGPYPGMFYPYTADINSADLNDTTWARWMMRDEGGEVIWKQLVSQRINNYEGFAFIDTASSSYRPLPTDSVLGTVPQPCQEFIAVLSMGGEEIDMWNPTPDQSLYSKVDYNTIFDEHRVTPIRTTYTYYAPLPNPLQFEYLSNNYTIYDTLGNIVKYLPEHGDAHLVFDMDASTEYTYYWIRNVGYDVDYNDPSEVAEGVESLGDGVFGYFIYDIPKGLGGYRIRLPKNPDGSYNIDSIVNIDGKPFSKWIDNPNTGNEVEIWEDPFQYHVYIPQLLIPPALDDDNFDAVDDWIDDRGDRFQSKTGFLHDAFMLDDGEDWLAYPSVPFTDDIYGTVSSGWYGGADQAYGDDYFETLGKTHIQIHADYTGQGREGPIEISKGGILVVEEIFGGSPWVIFSHVLSGFAEGLDYTLTSSVSPSITRVGIDTVCIRHIIEDENEPHDFNVKFDPYHVSYGYGEATVTTFAGAKDPCSLIEPVISMPAVLDPGFDSHLITLVPNADPENPDLAGYPRQVQGTFLEVRIEVMNGTDDNWINTTVEPVIPPGLGGTALEMSYVAYPRPLVPSHVDGSGNIIPGDQPGTFTTGWRFNQPEGEVLVKMGHTLNLLQPTRRAYFVFLFNIDQTLENGIYEIHFTMNGNRVHYTGSKNGSAAYTIPTAKFSIAEKDAGGQVKSFEELVLAYGSLQGLEVIPTGNFRSLNDARWSLGEVEAGDFDALTNTLEVSTENGREVIDLRGFARFPSLDTTKLYILQQGIIDSYNNHAEKLRITNGQQLDFTSQEEGGQFIVSPPLWVTPVGPRIGITNRVYTVNWKSVEGGLQFEPDGDIYVHTLLTLRNSGSDVSSNTEITIQPGNYFIVLEDSLPANCRLEDGLLVVDAGLLIPGDKFEEVLPFRLSPGIPKGVDLRPIIYSSEIDYEGTAVEARFSFADSTKVLLEAYDLEILELFYSMVSDTVVNVTARAGNRAMPTGNLWFRIYPIYGGGTWEFPIAEMYIDTFPTRQVITLSAGFKPPSLDKSVEFIAIIDDSHSIREIIEANNQLRTSFHETAIEDPFARNGLLAIYPNPVSHEVYLNYELNVRYDRVSLALYDAQGKLCFINEGYPGYPGRHQVVQRLDRLPGGIYFYRFSAMKGGEKPLSATGRLIKQ